MYDYADPVIMLPVAVVMWTILGVIKWIEARRER